MPEALASLLLTIIVVAIVFTVIWMVLRALPIAEPFKSMIYPILMLIGVLIILLKAWPLLMAAI